jgi:hypothetical protein
VLPATRRENCVPARLCSFLSVLLHRCSEKSSWQLMCATRLQGVL